MRLIDANSIRGCAKYIKTNEKFEPYIMIDDLVKLLDEQPTTYDVDKVVEELEEKASRYTKKYVTPYGNNGYRDVKAISIHKAIEIVKNGGVYDDVCEWKSASDGEFIQNPHTKRLYSNEPSMQNVYCNTCGKKIKAVQQMDEEEFCYCHNDDTDEYHDCLDYMECEECPYYYADLDQESD